MLILCNRNETGSDQMLQVWAQFGYLCSSLLLLQVVCCEGNAGFYEIGCTVTPLEGGYSVLGWNHPGFSGSTVCNIPP